MEGTEEDGGRGLGPSPFGGEEQEEGEACLLAGWPPPPPPLPRLTFSTSPPAGFPRLSSACFISLGGQGVYLQQRWSLPAGNSALLSTQNGNEDCVSHVWLPTAYCTLFLGLQIMKAGNGAESRHSFFPPGFIPESPSLCSHDIVCKGKDSWACLL